MRAKPFTLIEVAAAVAVAALVLTSSYGVVTTTMQSQKNVEDLLSVRKEGVAVLRLLSEDLKGSIREENKVNFRIDETDEFMPFTFNSVAWDPVTGRSLPASVTYTVEREDGKLELFRQYSSMSGAGGGSQALVMSGMIEWKVRYFDGELWSDRWSDDDKIPVALRVEFMLERNGGQKVLFSRDIPLPSDRVFNPLATEGSA